MTVTATYRVQCHCGAILYDDLYGDEHPTREAADAARDAAGWTDSTGRTICPADQTEGITRR